MPTVPITIYLEAIMRECLVISMWLAATVGAGAAETPKQPYPDLSEPKAAAFSLGVALVTGDAETVKSIYIGKDKDFQALLDAFVAARKSAAKYKKAVTARFGKNGATLLQFAQKGADPELAVGEKNGTLTSQIAMGEVHEKGDEATVGPVAFLIRLKKMGREWKVVEFPFPRLLGSETLTLAAIVNCTVSVLDTVADDIEKGKYQRADEVFGGLRTEYARQAKKLFDAEK